MIPTIIFIIFCDFLMFYQVFLSPEVKKYAVITNKHGIYELPHEFPDDLRLRILGNNERSGKCQNFKELYPSAHSSFKKNIYRY